ncbi:hypothetical protein PISMIDRAFT_496094 [Pisolithus microcarpus 441]|uniref:Uncharacterized protein n=1 Tax=Pisolithus microcarpus 441 TaxID=765257 RepID=A0A0C9Z0P2_9AGAM|nr:hypothetical protein PISMIDRAFT_496094 [Pisolithus microcarpus 441]
MTDNQMDYHAPSGFVTVPRDTELTLRIQAGYGRTVLLVRRGTIDTPDLEHWRAAECFSLQPTLVPRGKVIRYLPRISTMCLLSVC